MDNLNSRVAPHNCPIFLFNVCNFMMEQPDVEEKRYNRIWNVKASIFDIADNNSNNSNSNNSNNSSNNNIAQSSKTVKHNISFFTAYSFS